MKMKRSTIIALSLAVAAAIVLGCAVAFHSAISGDHLVITDLTRYPEVRKYFPPRMAPLIPATFPSNAKDITMKLEYRGGGMGPSHTGLDIEFTLPNAEAAKDYFLQFPPAPQGWQVTHDPVGGRIEYLGGDQFLQLLMDPTSGRLHFHATSN